MASNAIIVKIGDTKAVIEAMEAAREQISALRAESRKYRSALMDLFDSAQMIGGDPGRYIEETAGKALGYRK